MPQEEKEGFLRFREAFQLGDGNLVEVFGLRAATLCKGAPTGVVEVFVEAARAGVAGETDAGSVVAVFAQDLGQGADFLGQSAFVA